MYVSSDVVHDGYPLRSVDVPVVVVKRNHVILSEERIRVLADVVSGEVRSPDPRADASFSFVKDRVLPALFLH